MRRMFSRLRAAITVACLSAVLVPAVFAATAPFDRQVPTRSTIRDVSVGDGAYSLIMYVSGESDVRRAFAVDPRTGQRRKLILARRVMSALDPVFSPDGGRVLYSAGEKVRTEANQYRVWLEVARADGSGARRVTPEGGHDGSWSPDGRRIVYVFTPQKAASRPLGLYVAAADGTKPQRIYSAAVSHPRWSPDGKSIVFERGGVRGGVHVIDADGRRPRLLKRGRAFACPSEGGYTRFFSPDWLGARVMYLGETACGGAGGTFAVFSISRAGRGERQILGPSFKPPPTSGTTGILNAVPSPDGTAIAYEKTLAQPPFGAIEIRKLTAPTGAVVRVGGGRILGWRVQG